MASKQPVSSIAGTISPMAFVQFGEVAATLQKEVLEGYAQFNRGWLARMQSEIALWSELSSDLTASRSLPDAFNIYTKWVSRQMQMTAEDGQRLFNGYQQISQRVTRPLTRPVAIRKQGEPFRARRVSR